MSSSQNPKQRISFTDVERQRLRRYRNDQPSLTPQQLASWFQGTLGRKVSKSSVYDILSDKYAYLDGFEASDTVRRNRGPQWIELEDALFQWWQGVQPRDVTGKELKHRANEIWQTLPGCQGKKLPSFSDGWLSNWRERHGLGQSTRSTGSELSEHVAERPEHFECASMTAVPLSLRLLPPQPGTQCTPGYSPQPFNQKISTVAAGNLLSMAWSCPVDSPPGRLNTRCETRELSAKGSRVKQQQRVKRSKLAASFQMDNRNFKAFSHDPSSQDAFDCFGKTMYNSIRELHQRCNSQAADDVMLTGAEVWNVFKSILGSLDFSSQEFNDTEFGFWQASVAAANARKAVGLVMISEAFQSPNMGEQSPQPILEEWFLDCIDNRVLRSASPALASSKEDLYFRPTRNLPCRTTDFSSVTKDGRVDIWTRTYTTKDTTNGEHAVEQVQAKVVITPPEDVRAVPQTIIHLRAQTTRETSVLSTPTISFRNVIPLSSTVFEIARTGTSSQLQMMLSRGEASLNDCDPSGRSLINYALQGFNPSTLKFLITNVEDVDACEAGPIGNIRYTLIGLIIENEARLSNPEKNKRLACLKLMLHAEADLSTEFPSKNGIPAFFYELILGSYHATQLVLNLGQPFVDVNVQFSRYSPLTPLLWLASAGSLRTLDLHEKVFLFLQRGADIRARTYNGQTCLHIFIEYCEDMPPKLPYWYQEQEVKDILMCMVTAGADVRAFDNMGWTVSQFACRYGIEDLWRHVLAECGYDADEVFCLEDDFVADLWDCDRFPGQGVFSATALSVGPTKLSFKEYSQQRKSLECVRKVYCRENINTTQIRREFDDFLGSISESSDSDDYEWVSVEEDESRDDDSEEDKSGEGESEED